MLKQLHAKSNGILNFGDYKKRRYRVLYYVILALLFVAALVALLPPLWLFVTSFKTTEELYHVPYTLWPNMFDLNKIVNVWNYADFGRYFLNSLIVIAGAVICSVLFNGLLAYAIAILKPVGYKVVFGLVMLSYMIPAITSMVPLFKNITTLNIFFQVEGYFSYLPLWFVFGANAYYFIVFKNYFESIPKSLMEAARMDGGGNFRIFFSVVVPLSKPIISVIAIFTATAAWSDFLLPYLVIQDQSLQTVMIRIYSIQSTMATSGEFGPDMLLMLLSISIIPQIILFTIFQKKLTGLSATSGMKEV